MAERGEEELNFQHLAVEPPFEGAFYVRKREYEQAYTKSHAVSTRPRTACRAWPPPIIAP